jgi:hypothetical protein
MKKKSLKKQEEVTNTISGCSFVGVNYDKEAIEPLLIVSKALLNITEFYKGQNVQIDCLLKIGKTK